MINLDQPLEYWSIAELPHFCLLTQSQLVVYHVRDADRTQVGVVAR